MSTDVHDSVFAPLFEALTRAMAVPHVTDPTASQETRVVWSVTGAPVPTPARFQSPGKKRISMLAWPHAATITGRSQVEVQNLLAQFCGHIDRLQGPPKGRPALPEDQVEERLGYELKAGKIAGVLGGDGKALAYACEVAVTLYQPINSRIHPMATVTTVGVSASAVDEQGASASLHS